MPDEDFPTEYDAIVLGTGMAECIIAAALARIGQKVLHLDRNDYYSGDWACFHLEALQRWISKHTDGCDTDKLDLSDQPELQSFLQDGERLLELRIESESIRNVTEHQFIRAEKPEPPAAKAQGDQKEEKAETKPEEEGKKEAGDDKEESSASQNQEETECTKEWTMQDLKSQWRKFNIDLIPKVLYCRGPMVELLISSDIAKYCEFKTITRVLTHINGKLEQVPCSRSDVFSSKQVTMIEKRMMMKFLTFAMDYEKQPQEYEGKEEIPFVEFLKSQRLTANVQHYIKQAIAMVTDNATTLQGLEATQKFLRSLGRYGNTAFLWPVYGAGELPQCFCRMCAVFGGIYCLRRTARALVVGTDGTCAGIVDTQGTRIKTKHLIMGASYAGKDLLLPTGQDKTISRAILVTDRSIKGDGEDNITLLTLPTPDGRNVTVYELGSCAYACPKGLCVVQLTCDGSSEGPEKDLAPIIDEIFLSTTRTGKEGDERPSILWCVYFSVQDSSQVALQPQCPPNVHLVAGPDVALDFDQPIQQVKELFEKLCPGEEFLPKAPNPEDIIWDDGEGSTPTDAGFQSTDHATENADSQDAKSEGRDDGSKADGDDKDVKTGAVDDGATGNAESQDRKSDGSDVGTKSAEDDDKDVKTGVVDDDKTENAGSQGGKMEGLSDETKSAGDDTDVKTATDEVTKDSDNDKGTKKDKTNES